jgi:hypothetical protein
MNAMAKLLAADQPASLIKEAFRGPLIIKKSTGMGPTAGAP